MRFIRFSLFLIFWFLCFLNTGDNQFANAHDEKLSWAPPLLENPTTIRFTPDPNTISIIRLRDNEDAIIELPDNKIVETAGIQIRGGRHVQVIGGHIKATKTADNAHRAALRFLGTGGSVFVEGLLIDVNNKPGLDGLLVGGVQHKPDRCADVYIQNVHIKNVFPSGNQYHADGFQYYGCTKNTRIDRLTIRSQLQGMFLDPQHDISSIDLRNIDVAYTDPATAEGYILYIRNKPNGRRPPVQLHNVYAGARITTYETPREEDWERYAVHPPKHWPNGAQRTGNVIKFPDYPEITGEIYLGPPEMPMVPENTVGQNYISPGYIGIAPQL